MRVVSLLPSATEIISELGLGNSLVGRSNECTYPPEVQDLCAVCAVSSGDLASACPVGATELSLDPSTLDEVAASIETLAQALGVPERMVDMSNECSIVSRVTHNVRRESKVLVS